LALGALEAEDRRLALAFEQGGNRGGADFNRGLAYWVFEHNLVYEIFKAWLPVLEAHWEVQYQESREKADLVIFEGGTPVAVIETKWWMNNHQKTLAALDADVTKLRGWNRGTPLRVQLGFWYSRNSDEQWEQDISDVRKYCAGHGDGVVPFYAGRFVTDVAAFRESGGAYFAMVALAVNA
jgi:hypothetical protein